MSTSATVVYTDGACRGNPGPGGWAWAVPGGAFGAGAAAHTTNQRMELQAVLEALRSLPGPLHIVSDSTYVVNCFRDKWWEGWLRRNWTNSQKKPVANRDIWEPLIDEYRDRADPVTFEWVKGHSSDPMNDLVDRLAVEASQTQQPRHGDAPPTVLGPPDEVMDAVSASRVAADSRVPPGHRIAVFGHRPPELGGYDDNPVAAAVRRQLTEVFSAKVELEPTLVVLTGLRLGSEQLGAEAALAAGVPFVAVLPYPDPDKVWPEAARERFRELLDQARSVTTLERKQPADRAQAGASLARRDGWLVKHAHEAVLVWDGSDPALKPLHKKLEARFDADLWVLAPPEIPARR